MDDNMIVSLFLAKNEDAISETQKKYGKILRKISLNTGLSSSDSEEIENDTYLAAWNAIPPHEPRTYLFSFLAKIARQKSINKVKENTRLKRKADFVELNDELESVFCFSDNVSEKIDENTFSSFVSAFLKSVSKEKRIVFIRRYWFLDSINDISVLTGVSKGKVKTLLYRTRLELKEYLAKEGVEV